MSLFNLKGKVAIVTGSSRGIGRSIAHQLAKQGAKVVVSSRKQDACEVVVKEIQAAGGEAMAIAASISSKEQLQNLIEQTRAAWGPIDILVCNAATNPYYGPTTGMSDEVFDKVMRNNVLSNTWLCTMVYPDMKAKKDGAIVIVSSIGGLHGLQHFQSGRHAAGAQPGGGMGSGQHPGELHRAGSDQDRLCQGLARGPGDERQVQQRNAAAPHGRAR
jgi:NAD(P)-dependent dehydrogenase (short-subunit alcohol dehydrogenase family)